MKPIIVSILIVLKWAKFERSLNKNPWEQMKSITRHVLDQSCWGAEEAMAFTKVKFCEEKVWEIGEKLQEGVWLSTKHSIGPYGLLWMNFDQRKDFHLPPLIIHKKFHNMESWVPSHHAINPRLGQVSNTFDPSLDEDKASNDGGDQSEDQDINIQQPPIF